MVAKTKKKRVRKASRPTLSTLSVIQEMTTVTILKLFHDAGVVPLGVSAARFEKIEEICDAQEGDQRFAKRHFSRVARSARAIAAELAKDDSETLTEH